MSFALSQSIRAGQHHVGPDRNNGGAKTVKSMGVRPAQLTENRKDRLAKLYRILICQMCRPDTHALFLLYAQYKTSLYDK